LPVLFAAFVWWFAAGAVSAAGRTAQADISLEYLDLVADGGWWILGFGTYGEPNQQSGRLLQFQPRAAGLGMARVDLLDGAA